MLQAELAAEKKRADEAEGRGRLLLREKEHLLRESALAEWAIPGKCLFFLLVFFYGKKSISCWRMRASTAREELSYAGSSWVFFCFVFVCVCVCLCVCVCVCGVCV